MVYKHEWNTKHKRWEVLAEGVNKKKWVWTATACNVYVAARISSWLNREEEEENSREETNE